MASLIHFPVLRECQLSDRKHGFSVFKEHSLKGPADETQKFGFLIICLNTK